MSEPLRPRARRIALRPTANLLTADELRIERSRLDYLVSGFLGRYSRAQRPQVNALLVGWAREVVAAGQARPQLGYRKMLR
jgi:hypothetical protein